MVWDATYLREKPLIFGGNNTAFHPRIGLWRYGPRGKDSLDSPTILPMKIYSGIIGTGNTISKALKLFNYIKKPITEDISSLDKLGFPGLSENGPLKFSIEIPENFQAIIPDRRIKEALDAGFRLSRINNILKLYEEKIQVLAEMDPNPHLIICTIPRKVWIKCKKGRKRTKRIKLANKNKLFEILGSGGNFDFRNILKVFGLKYKITTQLIHESTLEMKTDQGIATTAWNLSVGMYYKANNLPWKLTDLVEGTCYVGISFFKSISEDVRILMQTSMAQVFLSTGESLILRGESFPWRPTRKIKEPHLKEDQAENLIKKVLKQFNLYKGTMPSRIVIYKTSFFDENEISGFDKGCASIPLRDYVTISETTIRFFRYGQMPLLRGTLISKNDLHFLYTTGYIPLIRTYPGPQIPSPLIIKGQFDSNINKICTEILSLTKLDWNNTAFCSKLPVTLLVSKRVGDILSEIRVKNIEPDPKYKYYM